MIWEGVLEVIAGFMVSWFWCYWPGGGL